MANMTPKILENIFEKFLDLVFYPNNPIDKLDQYVSEEVMGYGTTLDEKIFGIKGLKDLAILQRSQATELHFRYTPSKVYRKLMDNGHMAVLVDEIKAIMTVEGEDVGLNLRISSIWELLDGNWKLIHWHGSKPEYDSDGTDTWHAEEWKKKNEVLQKLVDKKTTDLENKNYELEIEAALERVRAVAMSMQKPDDLLGVCEMISDQLELLNVSNIRNIQVAIVNASKKTYLNYQYFTPYSKMVFEETEYNNNPIAHAMVMEMKKTANTFYSGEMKAKELKDFKEWRKKYKQFPDPILDKSPAVYYYFYSIGQGGLGLTTYQAISEEEHQIFKRFHKVFTLAYQRFRDIELALSQAREAQIEAALERVRARSMAMHKSEELAALSLELVKQVQALGVATWFCAFNIYDNDPKGSLEWGSNGQGTFPEYRTPREGIFRRYYEAGQRGEPILVNEIDENECPGHYEYLCSLPGVGAQLIKMKDSGISFPTSQIDHVAFFKYGYIIFITFKHELEAHDIFKRFAKVFEQTYTRFLDLKKAEAQARESKIEAALERARAQSMMMQHSSELSKTSQVFHEQLHLLGIESEFSYLWLPDENHAEHLFWATWQEEEQARSIYKNKQVVYPLDKTEASIAACYNAWESGNIVHINPVKAQGVKDYFNEWSELIKGVDKFKPQNYPEGLYYVDAYMKYGCFGIMIRQALSVEEQHILNRFSKEFERAYTRFLDLQKAEDQAREAQVELALERIRAQVTAMSESVDLLDIVVMMQAEFMRLGHEAHYFWHMRWLPDKYEKALTNADGTRIGNVMELPRGFHGIQKMLDWERANEASAVFALDSETAADYIDKMINMGRFQEIDHSAPGPDDVREMGGLTFVIARTTHGEIGYTLPGEVPNPPEKDIATLVRFAGVFDLAYRRFVDLKNAERRNRETQIELALERVRARTMAMYKSEELSSVASVLFEQMSVLGGDLFTFGIVLCDKYKDKVEQWHSIGKKGMMAPFQIPVDLDYIHQYRYDQWKGGEPLFSIEIPEDYIARHFELMFEIPSCKAAMDEVAANGINITIPGWEIDYGASFSHGYLLVSSLHPFKEDYIFPRFAKVFEQAYTRFLDLQKAETQTREATIEAALERVRARALAMQQPEEIKELAQVLRQEMGQLGVEELETSSIYINDETDYQAECWYAIKDVRDQEKTLVNDYFSLNLKETSVGRQMLKFYQSEQQQVSIVMKGKARIEWIRYCEEKSVPLRAYYGDVIPERTYHLCKFSHGAIAAATPGDFSEENWGLLQRAASVFSLAYSRFKDLRQARLDLQLLKEEKKRAEDALSELKSTQAQLIHAENMASLGELTAGIAHEIQNPLNFINNFSEVNIELVEEMKEEIDKGDLEEVKVIAMDISGNEEKIMQHGKRADSIVKGMLQHSRSSNGLKEATDINALADEYLRLAYHGLRAKDKSFNAKMITDYDANVGTVLLVPQDIGRVILNLITNAFYACTERSRSIHNHNHKNYKHKFEPTIWLSTKKEKEKVYISVKDNGKGIPQNLLEKIFQPFFTTKPTGEGTGLGLSMSYDIITKGHKGDLKIQTKDGNKFPSEEAITEFIIELPIKIKK